MFQKKISVIIPHYNIPHLLQRCLKSIPDRDDLEIIIVDDNSSEDVVDFDDFPGSKRRNTHVILLKESKGGGGARNIGLEHAKGEWIIFADADDFFNYCFNDFLEDYIDCGADLIFYNANSVDCDTYINTGRAEHLNRFIKGYLKHSQYDSNNLRYLFGEPWSKMIRKTVIDNNLIKFDETPIHNDTAFSYKIGFYSKNIKVDVRAAYCVTSRSGSVSKTIDDDKLRTRIDVFARANKFFIDNNIPVRLNGLYDHLARIKLKNKRLYRECFQITKNVGLSADSTKRKVNFFTVKGVLRKLVNKK